VSKCALHLYKACSSSFIGLIPGRLLPGSSLFDNCPCVVLHTGFLLYDGVLKDESSSGFNGLRLVPLALLAVKHRIQATVIVE
jgi:hypothetical protein